eukprot:6189452-Pleurochrysis_carterae.AAC.1
MSSSSCSITASTARYSCLTLVENIPICPLEIWSIASRRVPPSWSRRPNRFLFQHLHPFDQQRASSMPFLQPLYASTER